jgi:gamma-D-glutamyl-L-lysine dipeptidyl-peptidase
MIRQWLLLVLFAAVASVARADDETSSATPDPEVPRGLRHLARKIEPDLIGKPERLPQYVNFFSRELGNDNRICAFDVTATAGAENNVELSGFVEFPETRSALNELLKILGFKVDDHLERLPAADLGEKVFGLVKAPHSYSFDHPSGKRKQENDCLLGEPLLLLREQDGHLLAHGREGYLGYVPSADVVRVDEATYVKYLSGPRVVVLEDQSHGDKPAIPAGARLKWVKSDDKKVTAELPTGELVTLPATACRICEVPTAKIDDIISNAQNLLGTPYFWGGRTTKGIDCSGLVQMSYASAGVHLPRDAYQQFYVGQIAATRWHTAGMRRGDTLYFLGSDGKIRHTALYLGNDRYLQAIMPKVTISSFNPAHSEYDEDRHKAFAFAKRPLD